MERLIDALAFFPLSSMARSIQPAIRISTRWFKQSVINPVNPVVPQFEGSLADLGEIKVYPVRSRRSQEAKIWVALLYRYHYLKSGPLCGAQIRYLVKCDRGFPGALPFSSATFALACRDHYIGWTVLIVVPHKDL
jgi:hypothetical protein